MDCLTSSNGDLDLFEMVSLFQLPKVEVSTPISKDPLPNYQSPWGSDQSGCASSLTSLLENYIQDQRMAALQALVEKAAADELVKKQEEEIRRLTDRILLQQKVAAALQSLEKRDVESTFDYRYTSSLDSRMNGHTMKQDFLLEYFTECYKNSSSLDDRLHFLMIIRGLRELDRFSNVKMSSEGSNDVMTLAATSSMTPERLIHSSSPSHKSSKFKEVTSPQSCISRERAEPTVKMYGVRRREWGRWVSEIRCPGKDRLWLGTYNTQREAGLAHDYASKVLRGKSAKLNFPDWDGPVELPPDVMDAIHRKKQLAEVSACPESPSKSGKRIMENSTEICSDLSEDMEMFVESSKVSRDETGSCFKRQKRGSAC